MREALLVAAVAVAWVGHACYWTALLNDLYARPISKKFLKAWRLFTGAVIVGFPLLWWVAQPPPDFVPDPGEPNLSTRGYVVLGYATLCLIVGGVVFPIITAVRYFRRRPTALLAERSDALDLWKELGPGAAGDGLYPWVARLPFNDIFHVEFTELEVAVPGLPAAWDGLTIRLVSDVHFHGTPARAFFDRVFDRLAAEPPPDLVCLAGDYVDTLTHHEWIGPILGRLTATEGKFAILGNHDEHRRPEVIRADLAAAGYTVLGNGWKEVTIRGERCVLVGHEGPWFTPPPDLSAAPDGVFRLCLSHTPDNFYWGQRHGVGLMLCGHVHGGQIRLPVIGSIFVPSVYGRRFDMGVFEGNGAVMVVGRGLSGKEPLRFRCRPQVVRLTLRNPGSAGVPPARPPEAVAPVGRPGAGGPPRSEGPRFPVPTAPAGG